MIICTSWPSALTTGSILSSLHYRMPSKPVTQQPSQPNPFDMKTCPSVHAFCTILSSLQSNAQNANPQSTTLNGLDVTPYCVQKAQNSAAFTTRILLHNTLLTSHACFRKSMPTQRARMASADDPFYLLTLTFTATHPDVKLPPQLEPQIIAITLQ